MLNFIKEEYTVCFIQLHLVRLKSSGRGGVKQN